jgi:hypothetical protein
LQQLDLRRLLRGAGSAVIVLRAGIGDTLQEGGLVADLHGGDVAGIGSRALSPAINDPATATQVLDTIESLLGPWYHGTWTWPRCATAAGPFGWSCRSHAEGFAAGNFPLIWRDATGGEAR